MRSCTEAFIKSMTLKKSVFFKLLCNISCHFTIYLGTCTFSATCVDYRAASKYFFITLEIHIIINQIKKMIFNLDILWVAKWCEKMPVCKMLMRWRERLISFNELICNYFICKNVLVWWGWQECLSKYELTCEIQCSLWCGSYSQTGNSVMYVIL